MSVREIAEAEPAAETGRLPPVGLPVMALTTCIVIATETPPARLLSQTAGGLGVSEASAGQLVTVYALGTTTAIAIGLTAVGSRTSRGSRAGASCTPSR